MPFVLTDTAITNKDIITFTKFKQNIPQIIFPLIHTFSVHINIQISDNKNEN
jgi:hypothetical protein